MSKQCDLKNYLMNKTEKKELTNKNSKKKNIKNINMYNPNKNIKNILNLLDKECENLHLNTWNKLEKGIKLNRLFDFIDDLKIEKDMNEIQYNTNKRLIYNLFEKNKLNKVSDVNYDCENGKVLKINKLNLNDETLLFECN